MKSVLLAVGVVSLALAGCQTTANQQPQRVWVRTDGQPIRGNPKLMQQGELDWTICKGETNKVALGVAPIYWSGIAGAINASMIEEQQKKALVEVAIGCMAQRGYELITVEEAEARRAAYDSRRRRT
jgi:outer membrane lipoprotein SlyB